MNWLWCGTSPRIRMKLIILLVICAAVLVNGASKNRRYSERCALRSPLRLDPVALAAARPNGYAQISIDRRNGIAHIAGQTALQVDGSVSGTTIGEQLISASQNVILALEAIGAQPRSVTKMNVYLVGYTPDDLSAVVELGNSFSNPALNLLGISALAFPNLLAEIDATVPIRSTFSILLSACKCDGVFIDPDCSVFTRY